MKKARIWLIIVGILVVIVGGFYLYSVYYGNADTNSPRLTVKISKKDKLMKLLGLEGLDCKITDIKAYDTESFSDYDSTKFIMHLSNVSIESMQKTNIIKAFMTETGDDDFSDDFLSESDNWIDLFMTKTENVDFSSGSDSWIGLKATFKEFSLSAEQFERFGEYDNTAEYHYRNKNLTGFSPYPVYWGISNISNGRCDMILCADIPLKLKVNTNSILKKQNS